jgi:hypothetical protein
MNMAEKVRKLAALAGSDNEHEANAAARQACRLIREGKVTIAEAASDPAPRRRPEPSYWSPWEPAPAPAQPPPRPRRSPPRGPFTRRRDLRGASCVVCGEELPPDEAFSCPDGYLHGDCIPREQRP